MCYMYKLSIFAYTQNTVILTDSKPPDLQNFAKCRLERKNQNFILGFFIPHSHRRTNFSASQKCKTHLDFLKSFVFFSKKLLDLFVSMMYSLNMFKLIYLEIYDVSSYFVDLLQLYNKTYEKSTRF